MALTELVQKLALKIPTPLVAGGAKLLFGLPVQVKRLLGTPQTVEGNELDLDSQITLLMLKAQGVDGLAGGRDVAHSRASMRMLSAAVGAGTAPSVGVRGLMVDGAAGPLPARLYTPAGLEAASPLVVFFHGGGFVLGDLDTHDAPCRYIADRARVRVLAVDYRLAPEAIFPAAADDAVAATAWAIEHAEQLGADPARVAVSGDSAGGNLAGVAARELALAGGAQPAFSLLFYPVTGADPANRSRDTFGRGYFLTEADIENFRKLYTPEPGQDTDPKFDLRHADGLAGIGRTHVVVAGFDPLRDEGAAYAQRLRDAGVDATTQLAPGALHGFLNMVGVSADARVDVDAALDVLTEELVRS
ncbi:alpha/beta hydrolase [Tsukamurella ocularis]|uniref:alpha/beta hydrolase n=1 Tax=Tsukamurella ocularis TaxID=1970234 RepID=UPI0021686230|nr:alpha/beta hydrolase [Tsukamurella ocularis]MCS3779502.1 acetyl esterase [Tsukamurella ocularis]MCS3788025.1 acetyl esterase [Tsukamurella ocularis]MCS3852341.1 acetyl esterase [Tsukamurella ocularis]